MIAFSSEIGETRANSAGTAGVLACWLPITNLRLMKNVFEISVSQKSRVGTEQARTPAVPAPLARVSPISLLKATAYN